LKAGYEARLSPCFLSGARKFKSSRMLCMRAFEVAAVSEGRKTARGQQLLHPQDLF
jgi:hypothetical protein